MAQYSQGGDSIFNNAEANWWDNAQNLFFINPELLDENKPNLAQKKSSGKRSHIISKDRRGNYYKARIAEDAVNDLALDATLRAAAPYQKSRRTNPSDRSIQIKHQDLRRKVRSQRASGLLLFLLDLSWSMAVRQRMNATRGAILSLLTDAYQHRDRVGLITFQKDSAELVLPPTYSVTLAERSMKKVQVGGKTPLTAGLWKAYEVLERERKRHPDENALLIVLTDGVGNISMFDKAPEEESKIIAEKIAAENFRSIVIDLDTQDFDQGMTRKLAAQLKAPCYLISELKADRLAKIIRKEI